MILRGLAIASMLVAIASPSIAQELPGRVFADIPEDEIQDLLFFGQGRPLLVRLRVRVDGQGFRTKFYNLALQAHREADLDGDGFLKSVEARDVLIRMVKLLDLARDLRGQNRREPSFANVVTPGTNASVEDLARMLRRSFSEFRIDPPTSGEPPKDERAFALLDLDRDGRLSWSELTEAASSLAPLDLDDDEVITAEELVPYISPNVNAALAARNAARPQPQPVKVGPPSLVVADAYSWSTVRQIMDHYRASKKDETLDVSRIKIRPDTFARLDRDGDGSIDAIDLERAIRDSPDVEILIRLGRREPGESVIERVERPGLAPFGAPIGRKSGEDAIVLELEAEEIEFRVDPRNERATAPDRSNIRSQFRTVDVNRDGVLESKEVAAFPRLYELGLIAGLSIGELTVAGLETILDRRDELFRLGLVLGTAERGWSLLDLLDHNQDRRLTPRELHYASMALGAEDRDGRIARGEFVHQHRWTFGRGEPPQVITRPVVAESRIANQILRQPATVGIPDWFSKMDRNRDGDLTPREFLGNRSTFEAFDLDHDGLIAPSEAKGVVEIQVKARPSP